jgi:hypothetical protein
MKYLQLSLFLASAVSIVTASTTAHAAILSFQADLSGANEPPVNGVANTSSGTGKAVVTLDDVLNTMRVQISFSGLTGITTTAHIHSATAVAGTGNAGVATPAPAFSNSFPLGVKAGTYDNTFDMTLSSSYLPAFLTANGGTPATPANAQAALFNGIIAGKAYVNIHSDVYTAGEILGFLTPVAAPEPAGALGYSIAALGTIFIFRHKLKSRSVKVSPID